MNLTKEKRATHTPGPWEIVNLQDKLNLYSKENRYCCDQPIATCQPRDINERAYDINRANARLIAAAPELLEQCKLFEKVLRACIMAGDTGADLELEKLREVLAKAEGGAG